MKYINSFLLHMQSACSMPSAGTSWKSRPKIGVGFNRLFLHFVNSHLVYGALGIIKHFEKEIGLISQKKVSPSI